jgi:SAM-dependent methyltransferase
VADAYAGILEEWSATEYSDDERAMLAHPVFYYGRFLDPRFRAYALDTVTTHVGRAIEYLGLARGPVRVLDLGSGLGMQSLIFARYGADVVAVDLDPRCTALSEKRRRFFERRWQTELSVRFVGADFHQFARAQEASQFDAVFSMSAFAHIPPVSQTVAEISSLLTHESRVYLWDKNPDFLFLNHLRSTRAHRDEGPPRPRTVRRALEAHGFHVDVVTGGGAIPAMFWRWPATNGAVAVANRMLRKMVRLSFNYVIGAHRGSG